MKYRHYAPKADLSIIEGNEEDVVACINHLTDEAVAKGLKVGVIATDETRRVMRMRMFLASAAEKKRKRSLIICTRFYETSMMTEWMLFIQKRFTRQRWARRL